MITTFRPLHQLITVFLDEKKRKTEGGLELPDAFEGIRRTGTVRRVGPGSLDCDDKPIPLQPGDRVMLMSHQTRTPDGRRQVLDNPLVDDNGDKCALLNYSDILGVIEEAPTSKETMNAAT